jgi:mevalonate kinase
MLNHPSARPAAKPSLDEESKTEQWSASAPAKLILCGEHAVVYSRPAIALPLADLRAQVEIAPADPGKGITIVARDLRRRWRLARAPGHPLSELIINTLAGFGVAPEPDLRIAIKSSIPIASGMGSGAAVATALVRALGAYAGRALAPAELSALVYASEQRFHGTPSGIDNTVIAYEQPIWFERSNVQTAHPEPAEGPERSNTPTIEPIRIATPFTLVIGDTGLRSATRAPVGEVRRHWQAEPARYEALFDEIGALAAEARALLAAGAIPALGPLLSHNHALLQQVGVSSPELDVLVAAAQQAGALGAKLSGAGWGGVMLALVAPDHQDAVSHALKRAGAKRVLATTVQAHVD